MSVAKNEIELDEVYALEGGNLMSLHNIKERLSEEKALDVEDQKQLASDMSNALDKVVKLDIDAVLER